jgi:hypothetical protein
MQPADISYGMAQERTTTSARILGQRGFVMPIWLEILLDAIGYGGFVAIAVFHRPSGEKEPEHDQH